MIFCQKYKSHLPEFNSATCTPITGKFDFYVKFIPRLNKYEPQLSCENSEKSNKLISRKKQNGYFGSSFGVFHIILGN